ncbi:MAG TPA: acyltransferase family protein [Burkholderiaceae bacterium]|nr:acyltransferase family protein [Burkholderiaceae bacterium]
MRVDAPPERLHALDAVRAGALLLGIVLHGGLSFVPDAPDALWPIHDVSQTGWVGALVFVIHVFRMPVFFLVAGLLAHALVHRLGSAGFWRNRAARIALPLVIAWPLSFGLIAAVVVWMLSRSQGGGWPVVPAETVQSGVAWLHLWFLYVLLWLYGIVWLASAALRALDRPQRVARALDRVLRALLASPLRSFVLALPIACALWLEPTWLWRGGMPTPGYTLIPPVVPLFVFVFVFGIGWLIDRQRALLAHLRHGWALRLVLGLACAAGCYALAVSEFGLRVDHDARWRLVYALGYASGLIGCTLGCVGAGLRFLAAPSAPVRYLADASYWMYLAHLPLVMALQAALMHMDAPWWLKFSAVVLGACALLLWSYRLWVRPTWIGALLNGSRR